MICFHEILNMCLQHFFSTAGIIDFTYNLCNSQYYYGDAYHKLLI